MRHARAGDHRERIHDHGHQDRHLSRRQWLTGLGALGMTALARRPSLAQWIDAAAPVAPSINRLDGPLFNIERVSRSVYAAIARPAAMINCNAAIIVGSDEVLIVDSHSKPSAARSLIEQIRREITDRPVRYVINSHFHWDHTQGNIAYPQAFGASTEIISSTVTREWLAREGAPRLRESLASLPKQIADARARLAAAGAPSERERLTQQIAELESFGREMSPPQIILPTVTFDQRLVIHRDGREIQLLFLGRGHTAGDVIVHIPSERVVATGDLMHSALPYMGDGFPDEWPRTLMALEGLAFDRVVPGHGSVQHGKSILGFFRNYLQEINESVTRALERGDGLEDLQRALAPDRIRSLNSGEQLTRLEREARGRFGVPDGADLVKSSVANNIADVYKYYEQKRKKT